MGIPKFFGQLINKQKIKYEDAIKGTFPTKVSGLMIDLNDLLHFFSQKVYLYGSFETNDYKKLSSRDKLSDEDLDDIFINNIIARLEYYLEKYEPSQYFIVAVDGPAPLAKIAQQRIRRIGGGPSSGKSRFDNASLSPGTVIMEKIHLRLEEWFSKTFSNYNEKLPQFACYSSFHEPGEGEHKMIRILMKNKDKFDLDYQGLHFLCGQDSDLIMLGTLLPLKNVVHYREDREKEAKDNQVHPILYMVDLFKKYIFTIFRRDNIEKDFILMYFIFGNDFIPKNPTLDNASYTVNDLAKAYITNGKKLIDTRNGKIYRDRFLDFLSFFEDTEKENLDTIASAYNPNIHPPYPILTNNITKVNGRLLVDIDGFKKDWYNRAMETFNMFSDSIKYDNLEIFIRDMCENYLQMLQWNLDYYQRVRGVSWNLQYMYYFSPFLSDVCKLSREGEIQRFRDDWEKQSSILRQLIMISHPSKIRNIIPVMFHKLLDNELIINKTPEKPIIFADGKGKYTYQNRTFNSEHLRIVILPLVDNNSYSEIIDKESHLVPNRMKVYFRKPDYYIQNPVEKQSVKLSSKIIRWRSNI